MTDNVGNLIFAMVVVVLWRSIVFKREVSRLTIAVVIVMVAIYFGLEVYFYTPPKLIP